MIIDKNLVMSDAQAITSSVASSYIDTLAAGDAVAPGARLKVQVNTPFTTDDDATLTVSLQTADNSSFNNATTLCASATLAVTSIDAAGDNVIDIQIPFGVERYLQTYYAVGTGTFTAGKIDSRIVVDTAKTMDKNL